MGNLDNLQSALLFRARYAGGTRQLRHKLASKDVLGGIFRKELNAPDGLSSNVHPRRSCGKRAGGVRSLIQLINPLQIAFAVVLRDQRPRGLINCAAKCGDC